MSDYIRLITNIYTELKRRLDVENVINGTTMAIILSNMALSTQTQARVMGILRFIGRVLKVTIFTKGSILMIILFALKNDKFFKFFRSLIISCAISIALCANFNLDLDSDSRAKSLTVGLSRLLVVGSWILLYKKLGSQAAPFYCGLTVRIIPFILFHGFKSLYHTLNKLLKFLDIVPRLPTTTIRALDEKAICCICLEGSCDYTTPCRHRFHNNCLQTWTEVKQRCPICKAALPYSSRIKLERYFVLNYNEWRDAHVGLCGDWWNESVYSWRT